MPEYLLREFTSRRHRFGQSPSRALARPRRVSSGPAAYGPIDLEPEIITSLGEFERTYGDRSKLNFSDAPGMDNFLWHAVRAFFEEGGKRLYVSRVFRRIRRRQWPRNG